MHKPAALSANRVYVGLSVGLCLLMIGHTINKQWSDIDFWVWLGAVREFSLRTFDPAHPLIATNAPDLYMGPYSFVLRLVTSLTSVDPVLVIAIAGILNLILVLADLWRLTRLVSTTPWAPALALVFGLLAWGWQPWRWGGYLNLNSIGFGLPYGSTFA